jgi:hypothetical protein
MMKLREHLQCSELSRMLDGRLPTARGYMNTDWIRRNARDIMSAVSLPIRTQEELIRLCGRNIILFFCADFFL